MSCVKGGLWVANSPNGRERLAPTTCFRRVLWASRPTRRLCRPGRPLRRHIRDCTWHVRGYCQLRGKSGQHAPVPPGKSRWSFTPRDGPIACTRVAFCLLRLAVCRPLEPSCRRSPGPAGVGGFGNSPQRSTARSGLLSGTCESQFFCRQLLTEIASERGTIVPTISPEIEASEAPGKQ